MRRQVALCLAELDTFQLMRGGNTKNMEQLTHLLHNAVGNLCDAPFGKP